MMITVGFWFF